MKVGIEALEFYTPDYCLDLSVLAEHRGVDVRKYRDGIGQDRMAVPPPDEDVVTMAANAAHHALADVDVSSIATLMFATESGIDQSKAAGIYVHHLLGLPPTCTAFELKQACCSSTAGLQMALALVSQQPEKRVLLVASDIARYGLGAAGEPTQGAGAVAMVISANPKVLELDPRFGSYTEDVMDFWRPNYLDEALVDGKFSIKVYLRALTESWKHYHEQTETPLESFQRFCYHLPFTRMAEKAHLHLAKLNERNITREALAEQVEPSLQFNRQTGNCYTASLYEGLLSLIHYTDPGSLAGARVGLFSYGSGCMASFFGGTVAANYEQAVHRDRHQHMLDARTSLTYEQYEDFYTHRLPVDGREYATSHHRTGLFRLAGVEGHQRLYERVEREQEAAGERDAGRVSSPAEPREEQPAVA